MAIGAATAIVSLRGLSATIERMPRVVVPGKADLALEAGDYVGYGELRSQLHGNVYTATNLQLRCILLAAQGGEPVKLEVPTAAMSYGFGGFEGQSMFTMTIAQAGTYQLTCEGEGGPATLAVGPGIGGEIGVTLVGMLGGVAGMVAVLFLVRRRRQRARAASSTPEPALPVPG